MLPKPDLYEQRPTGALHSDTWPCTWLASLIDLPRPASDSQVIAAHRLAADAGSFTFTGICSDTAPPSPASLRGPAHPEPADPCNHSAARLRSPLDLRDVDLRDTVRHDAHTPSITAAGLPPGTVSETLAARCQACLYPPREHTNTTGIAPLGTSDPQQQCPPRSRPRAMWRWVQAVALQRCCQRTATVPTLAFRAVWKRQDAVLRAMHAVPALIRPSRPAARLRR